MRGIVSACLLLTLGATPAAQVSAQWSAVAALRDGTHVAVAFPNGRRDAGVLISVNDDDITIRKRIKLAILHRRDIASVSIREPAGKSRRAAVGRWTGIGVAAGLGWAILLALHDEDHTLGRSEALAVMAGAVAGAVLGANTPPKPTYHERLIYVRQ
ncbi:MAG: hypothetical protein ACRD1V_08540 [Vicinamibacterales bacterium]